jgi:hypothetical protein
METYFLHYALSYEALVCNLYEMLCGKFDTYAIMFLFVNIHMFFQSQLRR